MSNPFFIMKNKHAKSCGNPAVITNEDPQKYYGYFENGYGEQWIFIYDRCTKDAKLYGGDVGWEEQYKVKNGHVDGLILNEEEKMWLQVCYKAANVFSGT